MEEASIGTTRSEITIQLCQGLSCQGNIPKSTSGGLWVRKLLPIHAGYILLLAGTETLKKKIPMKRMLETVIVLPYCLLLFYLAVDVGSCISPYKIVRLIRRFG